MSKRLRGQLLAAIFTAGVGTAIAAPACAETLADAIALAYDSNPTLQAQRANQRALDETYVQVRTGWRPTVSLQGSATYNEFRTPKAAALGGDLNGDGIPDTRPGASYGITESNTGLAILSFSQPIWTGGRVAAAVSAAEADVMQGRETLRRVEAQVLGQVIQTYMDVRRDQEAVRIRNENVAVLRRQLEESQARFDVGEITRTDVSQSQARYAAARSFYSTAMATLASSRAAYASVVGQNPGELAPEPSLAYLLPASADEAFTVAEQYSPLLRAQQFAEQASRARVAGARADRMPSLSLNGSTRFTGAPVKPFEQDLYSRQTQFSATLTVPLFTGGLTSSRIRQQIERNNVDRINIETQRRSVLQTVTQGWNQLTAQRANIDSTAESVRAAQIAAEGTRQEQQVGLRTTLDVLNAEQELRNNELSAAAAKHDEYIAAITVLQAMGRLEARNLVPVTPQYDPKSHFRKLRIAPGWVPWEEPISIVDRAVTLAPAPAPVDKPLEKAMAPGLQPPPAVVAPKK